MTLIVDSAGKGAALTAAEYDTNVNSMSGINVVDATTSLTITAAHQNDTVEFTNAGAVAVTLDLLATILAAIDTTDYKVTLLNTGAGTVTITPNGSNSINTGAATIVLETDEFVTLHNDNSNLIWNAINQSSSLKTHINSPFTVSSTANLVSGIPAAKKVTVSLYRVSSDGTTGIMNMTIGDAGGLHTIGYEGTSSAILNGGSGTNTTYSQAALILNYSTTHVAATIYSGDITITRESDSAFNYVLSFTLTAGHGAAAGETITGAASVSLDTVLTQLSLNMASGGNFDSGSFSVHYEG